MCLGQGTYFLSLFILLQSGGNRPPHMTLLYELNKRWNIIHLFSKYFLSTSYVLVTLLDVRDISVNKTDQHLLHSSALF